ncbi:hypothetical protein TRFO_28407 [Tritrichomonas foetus]|uniref:COP9 signalosome complex subunit 3 n=1 Tax=Tritrichomonas foetus TaxID=1144522 RepID=A0A1J4JZR4_9EUKA|nr:hypothetical protein TRFO_28407 [Tritrichomonas foetus]|eukprot:OHT04178.1 hypothetical protein TRFO_28407 [Tritrichomonas foetus]
MNLLSRKNLSEVIKTVRTPSDILRIMPEARELADRVTSPMAKNLFAKNPRSHNLVRRESHAVMRPSNQPSMLFVQQAALILILPTEYCPQEVSFWANKLILYLDAFEQVIASGIMMRYAKAALILNQIDSTLTSLKYASARRSWAVSAYLFLCASIQQPFDFNFRKYSLYSRIDSMSFYYIGINCLMLYKIEKAKECFLHSLSLQIPSDFAKNAASHFALSCFLLHFELSQVKALISSKIEIDDEVLGFFTSNDNIDCVTFSDAASNLILLLQEEKIRRRIIRFSRTTSEIHLAMLSLKTGATNIEESLKQLNTEKVINCEIDKEGYVIFKEIDLKEKLKKSREILEKQEKIHSEMTKMLKAAASGDIYSSMPFRTKSSA